MASLSILLLAFTLKLCSFFLLFFLNQSLRSMLGKHFTKYSSSMLRLVLFFPSPQQTEADHLFNVLQLKALQEHFTIIAHCSSPLSRNSSVDQSFGFMSY